ncbi:MAG: hypothetical protein ACE5JS_02640 [Nitrospinota bacterium]
MEAEGWNGYTRQEYELALFVQQRVYQHYVLPEEERESLRGHLALVALWHLHGEDRIRFEVPLPEMIKDLPPNLPPVERVREETDLLCERLGLSISLKDLLYLMVLVEVTYQAAEQGKIAWLAPPR